MANVDGVKGLLRAGNFSTNVPGTCLGFVYQHMLADIGLASIGRGSGHYNNAIDAWTYADENQKHPGDRNPPPGSVVIFGPSPTRTDANADAGDIMFADGTPGVLYGTDITYGRTGRMTIAGREAQTERPYLGWLSQFLGHNLINIGGWNEAPPAPPAPPERTDDDEMLSQDAQNFITNLFNYSNNVSRREARYRLYQSPGLGIWAIDYPGHDAVHVHNMSDLGWMQGKAQIVASAEVVVGMTDDELKLAIQFARGEYDDKDTTYPAPDYDGLSLDQIKSAVAEILQKAGVINTAPVATK